MAPPTFPWSSAPTTRTRLSRYVAVQPVLDGGTGSKVTCPLLCQTVTEM